MKIFKTPFLAGLLFGLLLIGSLWISKLFNNQLDIGTIGSLSFFTLFPVAMILLYYQQVQGQNPDSFSLKPLLVSGFRFILGAAIIFGLAHFINASYIDPEWGQKAIATAKENWAAKGYSDEAIAGQIEQDPLYQSPLKWGLVIFGFYVILYGIIHIVLSPISFWLWRRWQTKQPVV